MTPPPPPSPPPAPPSPSTSSTITTSSLPSSNLSPSLPIGVHIQNVRRLFFPNTLALDHISLTIHPGEFVALLGPSGCGKSTLLKLIANLDSPSSGQIHFFQHSTPPHSPPLTPPTSNDSASPSPHLHVPPPPAFQTIHPIAYVFQDAHLLPWRSVLQNVMLPLELCRFPKHLRKSAATNALLQVGLADALHQYPAQLSGGMRMRVSLARALVTNPKILLLDEPFAALDAISRQSLDEQLYHLWQTRQITVIFVTHSIAEAAFLAQRALVFSKRPARILADHPIHLPYHRNTDLRGTPEFAHISSQLLSLLKQGGAFS